MIKDHAEWPSLIPSIHRTVSHDVLTGFHSCLHGKTLMFIIFQTETERCSQELS